MTDIVIFDMDGTLVDTNRMTARAFAELAEAYGLPVPLPDVVRDAIGLADLYFYREIYPGVPDERLSPLAQAIEQREGELGRQLGAEVLFPGVYAMLETLTKHGKKLYLASTGTRQHVRDMLSSGQIADFFCEIHCAQPDKEAMTAEILAHAGQGHAVFVGDTMKDVRAARANNLPALGAGFGYVKAREREQFDQVFDTPLQLLQYILHE